MPGMEPNWNIVSTPVHSPGGQGPSPEPPFGDFLKAMMSGFQMFNQALEMQQKVALEREDMKQRMKMNDDKIELQTQLNDQRMELMKAQASAALARAEQSRASADYMSIKAESAKDLAQSVIERNKSQTEWNRARASGKLTLKNGQTYTLQQVHSAEEQRDLGITEIMQSDSSLSEFQRAQTPKDVAAQLRKYNLEIMPKLETEGMISAWQSAPEQYPQVGATMARYKELQSLQSKILSTYRPKFNQSRPDLAPLLQFAAPHLDYERMHEQAPPAPPPEKAPPAPTGPSPTPPAAPPIDTGRGAALLERFKTAKSPEEKAAIAAEGKQWANTSQSDAVVAFMRGYAQNPDNAKIAAEFMGLVNSEKK